MILEKISLRDVGNEQIYDSYMGILRISPSVLDGQKNDSMSLILTNPIEKDNNNNLRQVILSDSDGIKLGAYFTMKVRSTSVRNLTTGVSEKQNVINVVTNTTNMFATQTFNNRSTLIVNKEKQTDKISPIQIYHESQSNIGSYDVLNYPIESPNDDSFFNHGNTKQLINYNNSVNVHEQLMDALYQKPKSWYDKEIDSSHHVKVGGKIVYTQNKDYEQVPVLYTKDYILGHYNGHTARITEELKSKFVNTAVGTDRLTPEKSLITKLSFINFDQMVWDIINDAASGNLRQCDGRYNLLGIGENESICERLFSAISPPQTAAPILATGVSPGIVMNHVMPFRRFIFHVLRQEIRNSADEGNDYKNLRNGVKQYITDKKITAIAKSDPGFVNPLTKEFVLCDGKELTYDNYPSVNTDNTALFQHDDKGIVQRDSSTKKPKSVENKSSSDVYKAMSASNSTNAPDAYKSKVVVPSLLATCQKSPRYLRGLNWDMGNTGLDLPIDFATNSNNFNPQKNDKKYEVVKGSEYGLTQKNYNDPGVYRMQADWKATEQRHKHECFYDSKTENMSNTTGNIFSSGKNIHPLNFDVLNPGSYKDDLMKYSFTKNKTNSNNEHVPNAWDNNMPVPLAGLFGWKATTANIAGSSETVANNFVIQNSAETTISSDAKARFKQLEQINYSEGAAPIANKGGTNKLSTPGNYIYCYKRKKTGRHNRLRDWYVASYGGYKIQKATEGAEQDVPRCITSLPVENIEKEKAEYEPPYTMKIGDQTVTPDMTLSFPPTTVLLPLFKI